MRSPSARRHRPLPEGPEEEGTRAVRVLRVAGREAALPEQGRLLIADEGGDRDRRTEDRRVGLGDDPRRRDDAWQDGMRDADQVAQLDVPGQPVDVEEEGPTRVGDVGRVDPAAGQAPEQERIDRPRGQLAPLGPGAEARRRVEDVGDLRAAEVGVQRQAGPLPEQGLVAGATERRARRCGDPALPDDRVGDRPARGALPDDDRLALVRDADRGDVGRIERARGEGLACRLKLRAPDRLGVMGHVPGRREALRELVLGGGAGAALRVEDDRPRRRRPLIERQKVAGRHPRRSAVRLPGRRPGRARRTRGSPSRGIARPRPPGVGHPSRAPRPSAPRRGRRSRPPDRGARSRAWFAGR